jgi:hypothetical protein
MSGGWGSNLDRLVFQIGGGLYRIQGGTIEEQTTPSATSLTTYAGVEAALKRWSAVELIIGVRGWFVPNAKGERLWFIPLELSLRIR